MKLRDRINVRRENSYLDYIRLCRAAVLRMMQEEEAGEEIAELKSLVDGITEIIEIYPAESPAQKEWKADWLAKAREALK